MKELSLKKPVKWSYAMGTSHFGQQGGGGILYADQVLKNGKLAGVSSWRNSGTRQKEIRAVVSRFPYLNEDRNEDIDVSAIPCRVKA
ncbi:MAG: hypothetical protein LBP74_03375 [Treponema sp.]|jgi:hypothetical protein|nr:hypothetical protein [Treponema sp.]